MKVKAMLYEPGKDPRTVSINLMNQKGLVKKMGCSVVMYVGGFSDPRLFSIIGIGFKKPQKMCKAIGGRILTYGPILVGYAESPIRGTPSNAVDIPDEVIADLHKWIGDVPSKYASEVGDNY